MYKLYSHNSCALSRSAKILLHELNYDFQLVEQRFWIRDRNFLQMNPAGELPILSSEVDESNIVGFYPLIEYLFSKHSEWILLDPHNMNEIRRLIHWFNYKFLFEVTKYLVDEKLLKLLINRGSPDSRYIRLAKENLQHHLEYMNKLLQSHEFLVYDKPTVADIVAASHISIIDYLGEIDWYKYEEIKNWFLIVKSRPSFQVILKESLGALQPPSHYKLLDF